MHCLVMRFVPVLLTLRSTAEGGRNRPVSLTGRYRPHVRVGEGEVLGVVVVSAAVDVLAPGESTPADLQLLYDVDYSALQPGASFSVLEGRRVVGAGEVTGAIRDGG